MSYGPLVAAAELHSLLTSGAAVVVVDCRFVLTDPAAGAAMYAGGHLSGARYAHLDDDLSAPRTSHTGRHPLPAADRFVQTLGNWGVQPDTLLVAYDQAGGPFAARLWWLSRWVGHRQAAVLNGGIAAWLAAGYPVTKELPTIVPTNYVGEVNDDCWLTTKALEQTLSALTGQLLDAREAERFAGQVEPIDPVAGHVPGAMNAPWKENLDRTGAFHSPERLRERFHALLAGRSAAETIHMCGSGVTACHNLLAMEVAGLPGSKLYAGSWSEWICDPVRPVVRDV